MRKSPQWNDNSPVIYKKSMMDHHFYIDIQDKPDILLDQDCLFMLSFMRQLWIIPRVFDQRKV
jgi:hypothetical protein